MKVKEIITFPVIWDGLASQLIRVLQPGEGEQGRLIPSFVPVEEDGGRRGRGRVEVRRGQWQGGEGRHGWSVPLVWVPSSFLILFLVRVKEQGAHGVSRGRGRPPEKGLHVFQAKLWVCHRHGHSGCCWSRTGCVMMLGGRRSVSCCRMQQSWGFPQRTWGKGQKEDVCGENMKLHKDTI